MYEVVADGNVKMFSSFEEACECVSHVVDPSTCEMYVDGSFIVRDNYRSLTTMNQYFANAVKCAKLRKFARNFDTLL